MSQTLDMVVLVARGLGALREEVAFLGGAVTGLLITDPAAPEIRPTDDVDVIVEVASQVAYASLGRRLRVLGFREDKSEGAPTCRWIFSGQKVDVMPTSAEVLGFANRWYASALREAETRRVGGLALRVVTAPYFLATKLEAFDGRGQGDYRASHDLEDLVAIVDGRLELADEVAASPRALRTYLKKRFREMLDEPAFI